MPELSTLEQAMAEAIAERFFTSVEIGRVRDPVTGQEHVHYATSGVAMVATQLFQQHATELTAQLWEHFDIDAFATRVAEQVAAQLLKPGTFYAPNPDRARLNDKLEEYLVAQLGERAIRNLDVTVKATPDPEAPPALTTG
jgi:hypothetical protein